MGDQSGRISPSSGPGNTIQVPESPAPNGYLANPYKKSADEAHRVFNEYLSSQTLFQEEKTINGVRTWQQDRANTLAPTRAPIFKGMTFIAHLRPVEILSCIHLFSYRIMWDTRMSSGVVLQRYHQHKLAYYLVTRGISPIYEPRDDVGVQEVRSWGPNRVPQRSAVLETEVIDIAFKSTPIPEAPPQQGKVRMEVIVAGYRIEWVEELQGCNVTWLGDVDLGANCPTYIWNALNRELPVTISRLRSCIEQFGYPPYVLDYDDRAVLQMEYYFPQTRLTTFRKHVNKPGSYIIVIDRDRMYPAGIEWPPLIEGEGAHAVQFEERGNHIIVTVSAGGVGKEYIIMLTRSRLPLVNGGRASSQSLVKKNRQGVSLVSSMNEE